MLTLLIVFAGLAGVGAAPAAEPSENMRPAQLRMLYSETLFHAVNRTDALAALKVWVQSLGRRQGFALAADTDWYLQPEDAAKRLRGKTVELLVCNSVDYLQLAASEEIEPVCVPTWRSVVDDYVLLTRRDRNLATLADLRGKRIVLFKTGANLGHLWIDVLLGESGLGSMDEFFSAKSEVTKVSAVILPVFFGKADVAVAKRWGWETMKEMNPQLSAQLQILATSPVLPEAVACLNTGNRDFPFRAELVKGLAELHTDPHGQQLLLMFKIDRMAPFEQKQLDGVRDLLARWAKLAATRAPGVRGSLAGENFRP